MIDPYDEKWQMEVFRKWFDMHQKEFEQAFDAERLQQWFHARRCDDYYIGIVPRIERPESNEA